jgi:hypothetical protein
MCRLLPHHIEPFNKLGCVQHAVLAVCWSHCHLTGDVLARLPVEVVYAAAALHHCARSAIGSLLLCCHTPSRLQHNVRCHVCCACCVSFSLLGDVLASLPVELVYAANYTWGQGFEVSIPYLCTSAVTVWPRCNAHAV